MNERPGDRVRVTGPPRRTPAPASHARRQEIDAATRVGRIYLGSLLREQLRLAAGVLAVLALGVGSLPLVFHLFPDLVEHRLFGVPLPWWALGVLVYPVLVLLGWWYVRAAEANEDDFADLLDSAEEA